MSKLKSDLAMERIAALDEKARTGRRGKPYNGHRSWNAWNVSLWIGNDESLYNLACDLVRQYGRKRAARRFPLLGERTPDGAVYNVTCVYEAMEGL
jgi:hypothetical protein